MAGWIPTMVVALVARSEGGELLALWPATVSSKGLDTALTANQGLKYRFIIIFDFFFI